jgi:hypothetical protein
MDHLVGLRGGVGSIFSLGAVHLSNSVGSARKVVTYGDCPQEAYEWHMWTGIKIIRVMCIRFPPARCTSIRITVTLGYE